MVKPIFDSRPVNYPFTEVLFDQFSSKVTLGEFLKGLEEVKVTIHSFLLVHRSRHLSRDGEL